MFSTNPPLPAGARVNVPDRAERDRVLGEYMDAWSRTENLLRLCIQELLGIDQVRVQAVLAAMMTRQTIDLLESLAQSCLRPEGVEQVKKLCRKLADRNRRRNSIVHGVWNCHITNPTTGDACWIRRHTPIQHDLAKLSDSDPKVAGIYVFTLAELASTTQHLMPVIDALGSLHRNIPGLMITA